MSKEYLILGSDSFWYAMCESLEEAMESLKNIKKCFDETGVWETQSVEPDDFYIYEAEEVQK